MRRNWHKGTSDHILDSTIRLSDPENLYSRDVFALRRRMWTKIAYFHCACAETGTSVLPSTILTAPFNSATPKTCIVVTFLLYDEGCGRKSHIFTAHAQKREQYCFRSQFEQHHSTQRPRKLSSHEIVALRQRIRWGACSQRYVGREQCVQLLVYFYVTLYNRFWTLATLREYYFIYIFFVRIIWLFFAQKSTGSCLILMQIKESGKNGFKVSIIVFKFPFKSAKIRILWSCLARPTYTSDANVDKTRSTANLSAVRDTWRIRYKRYTYRGPNCDSIIPIITQTSAQWVM